MQAIAQIQTESMRVGTDRMSTEDIRTEVKRARSVRKRPRR